MIWAPSDDEGSEKDPSNASSADDASDSDSSEEDSDSSSAGDAKAPTKADQSSSGSDPSGDSEDLSTRKKASKRSSSKKKRKQKRSKKKNKKKKSSKSRRKTSQKRRKKKKKKKTASSSEDSASEDSSTGDSSSSGDSRDAPAPGPTQQLRKRHPKAEAALVQAKQEANVDASEVALTPGDTWAPAAAPAQGAGSDSDSEGEFVGPVAKAVDTGLMSERDYGNALLPGEGQAIAGYVMSGERIPRRGEVGMSSEQISHYEDLGFVMSGSRHKRMNAIRIRKENQVYSAEEKRALAMLNFEERANREKKIMAEMRQYLQRKSEGN